MNYYIQGCAAKAGQIKAAFEKLGYNTNVNGWNFNADCGVYFTNEADKSVDYTSIETFVNLIKTHPDYQELQLPVEPKFKVGDKIQAKDIKMYVYTVLSVDLQNQIYIKSITTSTNFCSQSKIILNLFHPSPTTTSPTSSRLTRCW